MAEFDNNAYKVPAAFMALASVAKCTFKELVAQVKRDGKFTKMVFERGKPFRR